RTSSIWRQRLRGERSSAPSVLGLFQGSRDDMKSLESVGGLAVSQKKEWGEILSDFEGSNKYVVSDERGTEL
ncbi:MAG TPA: hypothetical protein DC060_05075, partial [Gemmatimonadetes bacterium]|nr:hypothetical protein [Gemmatimonadota bacterium]